MNLDKAFDEVIARPDGLSLGQQIRLQQRAQWAIESAFEHGDGYDFLHRFMRGATFLRQERRCVVIKREEHAITYYELGNYLSLTTARIEDLYLAFERGELLLAKEWGEYNHPAFAFLTGLQSWDTLIGTERQPDETGDLGGDRGARAEHLPTRGVERRVWTVRLDPNDHPTFTTVYAPDQTVIEQWWHGEELYRETVLPNESGVCPVGLDLVTRLIERGDQSITRKVCLSPSDAEVLGLIPWDANADQQAPCVCGHPYERHFDSHEEMSPIGCKYCACRVFRAAPRPGGDTVTALDPGTATSQAAPSADERETVSLTSKQREMLRDVVGREVSYWSDQVRRIDLSDQVHRMEQSWSSEAAPWRDQRDAWVELRDALAAKS